MRCMLGQWVEVWGWVFQYPILGRRELEMVWVGVRALCPPPSVRPMDLALLVCNMAFLVFLLVKLVATVRKLHGSLPLFKILYVMVRHSHTLTPSHPHIYHTLTLPPIHCCPFKL